MKLCVRNANNNGAVKFATGLWNSCLSSAIFPLISIFTVLLVPCGALAQVNVVTAHNDIARDGQNLNETILTPANVNPAQFGKLFSYTVHGGIAMQPLYVAGVNIPGKGTHNVVYVATTTNDFVYAFDADNNGGVNANPLWQTALLTTGANLNEGFGIYGTPVIDLPSQTMFLVSSERKNGTLLFRLHALNIQTGAESLGGPVLIQASVPGTGTGSTNGILTFNPTYQYQRASLLSLNGVVYVAFGSNGDNGPWHGWLFSFNETNLKMIEAFCTSSYGTGDGIWMSEAGLAAEVNNPDKPYGRMFISTANGSYQIYAPTVTGKPYSNPQNQYGMSVLNLDLTGGNFTVEDTFTLYNWSVLDRQDGDLGSGGPVILPTQTMASGKTLNPLIMIGKTGKFYLLDRDSDLDGSNNDATEYSPAGLGGFNATADQVVQEIQTPTTPGLGWGAGVWGTEAYWNGNIYTGGTSVANESNTGGSGDSLTAYSLVNGVMSTTPTSQSHELFTFPGPTPSVSAHGNQNAIVWLLKNDSFDSSGYETLLAYDATNLANTLYSSNTNLARDNAGAPLPFNVPTIANGKVYTGSQTVAGLAQLSIYGLLSNASNPVAPPPVLTPGAESFTTPVTVAITDAVPGATIYYTTNGTTPTAASAVYTKPLTVAANETITAIASANGYIQSLPASAAYVSSTVPANPVFSLAPGTYVGVQTLTITENTAKAIVYYTVDGSTPSFNSAIYSQPISISASETVQAIAYSAGDVASALVSSAYTIQPANTFDFSGGFALAQGPITFNGTTGLDDYRLQLTNGGFFEAGSAFYATPVNIQAFTTNFTFQLSEPIADGITFTIQNNSAAALGGVGGSLGYAGIPNSVAIKFDLHDNEGEGVNSTGLYINGALPMQPSISLVGTGIDLHDGDYMNASVIYDGANLTLTITDAITLASWTHTWVINIPATVGGNTAYVGFTGGTGAGSSSQKLNSWTYLAGPPLPNYTAGFAPGGLSLNGGSSFNGSRIRLTDGASNEARSAFFTTPVNIQQFSTSFQFQLTDPIGDGFTFAIQGSGPAVLGGIGGALGYPHLANSLAIKFDLYSNKGEGPDSTGLYTAGASPTVPSTDLSNTGINLHSGDIFNVQLTYVGTTLTVLITDTVTNASATQIYTVNIPAIIGGNTAWVGFTAGSGGSTAIQEILDWNYTPIAITGPAYPHGFLSASQLTLNGGAALNGNALQLTDGQTFETRSAYFNTPVNVQAFTSSFDFQFLDPTADGSTFVIQGNGLNALGSAGGGLGYGGMLNSVAIKFDLHSNAGEGPDSTALLINGLHTSGTNGSIDLSATGINFHSGDLFNALLTYNGTTLTVVLTDTVTNATATQTYTVNIPSIVGGPTAYVGFTGASGSTTAIQNFLNWTYAAATTN